MEHNRGAVVCCDAMRCDAWRGDAWRGVAWSLRAPASAPSEPHLALQTVL